jgi:hypothetical protein
VSALVGVPPQAPRHAPGEGDGEDERTGVTASDEERKEGIQLGIDRTIASLVTRTRHPGDRACLSAFRHRW